MYPSYLCCHCGKLEGRVSLRVRLPVLPGRIMIPGPIMMALRVESQTPPPSAWRATEYPAAAAAAASAGCKQPAAPPPGHKSMTMAKHPAIAVGGAPGGPPGLAGVPGGGVDPAGR